MLCIQTPKSEAILFVSQCVSVSVCQCVTLRTRSHVTDLGEYKYSGRLGTSNCDSLFSTRNFLVGHCLGAVVVVFQLQPFSLCWENFEELSAAN